MYRFVLAIFLCLVFAGCSSIQYVGFSEHKPRDESQAVIYVIRPSTYGSTLRMKVFQNDKLVGKLGPKNYLTWEVNPDKGEVYISSKSENKDLVVIKPTAGRTYYIKQRSKPGWFVSRTGLEFMNETEALEILQKMNKPKVKYIE